MDEETPDKEGQTQINKYISCPQQYLDRWQAEKGLYLIWDISKMRYFRVQKTE